MALSIDRELDYLKKIPVYGPYLANALRILVQGHNNLATNVAADSTQTLPAPDPPQQLDVKTNGNGLVHAVITDHSEIRRGIHYFLEYDTDPSFRRPQVKHLGASRSSEPLNLPEMDDDGNPQQWYFRAYSQMPGSHPSAPIKFGGETATAVNPGGGQMMTLIPSTGSGTAPANGQSAGQGFGKVLNRLPTTDIRTIKGA